MDPVNCNETPISAYLLLNYTKNMLNKVNSSISNMHESVRL